MTNDKTMKPIDRVLRWAAILGIIFFVVVATYYFSTNGDKGAPQAPGQVEIYEDPKSGQIYTEERTEA